jgi:hypothetical protein
MTSLTLDQIEWSKRPKQGLSPTTLRALIQRQEGRCALSGAPLIFAKANGTPVAGGKGCHPLYAAVDHVAPGSRAQGHQLVCYDLNDLKGHLPPILFAALRRSTEWKNLMSLWRAQAERDPSDRGAFKALIRTGGQAM